MRTPHPYRTVTRPPRGGFLYAVRYIDVRGEPATHLYRMRHAAECMADRVTDAGGAAVIFVVPIAPDAWQLLGVAS